MGVVVTGWGIDGDRMNVRRTFFKDGADLPSYELENGDIKNPYTIGGDSLQKVVWWTDGEFVQDHKRLWVPRPPENIKAP